MFSTLLYDMPQTTVIGLTKMTDRGDRAIDQDRLQLIERYDEIVCDSRLHWSTSLRLSRKLGSGGQGSVYLAQRVGADGFNLPVAVKFFSPERYNSLKEYDLAMTRIGQVASQVARIQNENLLVVNHFLDRDRIRIMVMEWIEGFDLRKLLTPKMYGLVKDRFSSRRWEYINESLVTVGPVQPRIRPAAALTVIHDCLAALAALHREGIVHSDIKPSNIMLKRSGQAKIIDIGLARACTPAYTAPEILTGAEVTERSDLASLGYVLIEMLAGQPLFDETPDLRELISAKTSLADRLPEIVPQEISSERLLSFLTQLIATDPQNRFATAASAESSIVGLASAFSSETKNHKNDIRIWIEELLESELAVDRHD